MMAEGIIKFIYNEAAALLMLAAATGLVGLAQRHIDKHGVTGKRQVAEPGCRLPDG